VKFLGTLERGTLQNHKRRRSNVVDIDEEAMVRSKYNSDNSRSIEEIIMSCDNLGDVVIKTTQNTICDQLRRNNLIDNGCTFQLKVKQLYKPIEG